MTCGTPAINSITKYNMATIERTQLLDGEMQKLAAKCLGRSILGKSDKEEIIIK